MTDLIEPNWHPILVHFVVAFLLTAPVLLIVSALAPAEARFKLTTQAAGDWMLALGILFAAAAVAAGLQAYYSVAHDTPSHAAMTDHRNFAFATASIFLLFGAWRFIRRRRAPSILFAVVLLASAGLLATTAWKGGRLVYHHGLGVASLPAVAGEGHDHGDGQGGGHDHSATETASAPDAAPAADTTADLADAAPKQVVAALHEALARGDAATVEVILAPDVFIMESGGAERSFAEYAGHHMPADMEFTAAVAAELVAQTEDVFGDAALVISERTNHGEFRGRPIHARTMETMVLKRGEAGWRIAHIHWSSADIKEEDHEH